MKRFTISLSGVIIWGTIIFSVLGILNSLRKEKQRQQTNEAQVKAITHMLHRAVESRR